MCPLFLFKPHSSPKWVSNARIGHFHPKRDNKSNFFLGGRWVVPGELIIIITFLLPFFIIIIFIISIIIFLLPLFIMTIRWVEMASTRTARKRWTSKGSCLICTWINSFLVCVWPVLGSTLSLCAWSVLGSTLFLCVWPVLGRSLYFLLVCLKSTCIESLLLTCIVCVLLQV